MECLSTLSLASNLIASNTTQGKQGQSGGGNFSDFMDNITNRPSLQPRQTTQAAATTATAPPAPTAVDDKDVNTIAAPRRATRQDDMLQLIAQMLDKEEDGDFLYALEQLINNTPHLRAIFDETLRALEEAREAGKAHPLAFIYHLMDQFAWSFNPGTLPRELQALWQLPHVHFSVPMNLDNPWNGVRLSLHHWQNGDSPVVAQNPPVIPEEPPAEKPPEVGDTTKPPETGDTEKPPETGNTEKPPETGNTEKPPETGNTEKPPVVDYPLPPADDNKIADGKKPAMAANQGGEEIPEDTAKVVSYYKIAAPPRAAYTNAFNALRPIQLQNETIIETVAEQTTANSETTPASVSGSALETAATEQNTEPLTSFQPMSEVQLATVDSTLEIPQDPLARQLLAGRIIAQIAEQAAATKAQNLSVLQMELSPKNLGKVMLIIQQSAEGMMQAKLLSENGATRSILNENLAELRASLRDAGINLQDIEVAESWIDNQLGDRNFRRDSGGEPDGSKTQKIDEIPALVRPLDEIDEDDDAPVIPETGKVSSVESLEDAQFDYRA